MFNLIAAFFCVNFIVENLKKGRHKYVAAVVKDGNYQL